MHLHKFINVAKVRISSMFLSEIKLIIKTRNVNKMFRTTATRKPLTADAHKDK